MAPVPAAFRREIFRSGTGDAIVQLVEITSDTLSAPLRFANVQERAGVDPENPPLFYYRGEAYAPYPFQWTPPAKRDDQVPQGSVRIANVDPRIVRELRRSRGETYYIYREVLESDPSVPVYEERSLYLSNSRDSAWIDIVLGSYPDGALAWGRTYDKDGFPALHTSKVRA